MARTARVIVPDFPHHITRRGNRRLETFHAKADYREYLTAEWCNRLAMRPFDDESVDMNRGRTKIFA